MRTLLKSRFRTHDLAIVNFFLLTSQGLAVSTLSKADTYCASSPVEASCQDWNIQFQLFVWEVIGSLSLSRSLARWLLQGIRRVNREFCTIV